MTGVSEDACWLWGVSGWLTYAVDVRAGKLKAIGLRLCLLAHCIDWMPPSLRLTACRGRRGLQYKSSDGCAEDPPETTVIDEPFCNSHHGCIARNEV